MNIIQSRHNCSLNKDTLGVEYTTILLKSEKIFLELDIINLQIFWKFQIETH